MSGKTRRHTVPLLNPHGVFGLTVSIFKSDSLAILRIIRYPVDAAQATDPVPVLVRLLVRKDKVSSTTE